MSEITPRDVVDFWQAAGPAAWWRKDAGFDDVIRDRFGLLVEDALTGRLTLWPETATGALALLLLLDQFPRNIFRGSARQFDGDPTALAVANAAIAERLDSHVPPGLCIFFYVPFQHSEQMEDQTRSVALFKSAGDPEALKPAREHHAIIARFGRFPHRNALLGRTTTAEEQAFLNAGGFAG